jgi:4-hydroxy-tetrahydrodipicolinate synthase
MMSPLRGVFAPIVTPFRAVDGEIDHPWMGQHLAYLRAHGCDGVIACGTNGEAASLSVAERQAVLETTLRHADGLRVVAGTGAAALTDAITLTRHAFSLGVRAVLVMPPFYFKRPPEAGIAAWFQRLCDAAVPADGQVWLYHIPQTTGVPFTDTLLAALLATHGEVIRGIKDSTGDPAEGRRIRAGFPQLTYFVGNDHLVAEACRGGAAGSISAGANVFPDLVRAVQQAVAGECASMDANTQSADIAGAQVAAAQAALTVARRLLESYPLQASTKAALHTAGGLPMTYVRPPQAELDAGQRAELDAALFAHMPHWRPFPVA